MKNIKQILSLSIFAFIAIFLVSCNKVTTQAPTSSPTLAPTQSLTQTPTVATTVDKTQATTVTAKKTDAHLPIVKVEFPVSGDFTDLEGNTRYGWKLVANETNQTIWDFGEDGMVEACRAAEGDTAEQRVYNYALRNLSIQSDDEYSVSATFTPDADSDLSAERTYGIVCFYVDADNYLMYWLQQKVDGAWSGQFYGRIDGAFRKLYIPNEPTQVSSPFPYANYWRKGEYYDMWWDQANDNNPQLVGQKNVLLTTEVTLKVVSKIESVTVGEGEDAETLSCRYFEIHQEVNSVDKLIRKIYVQQITSESPSFYTGLYSEQFSVAISNFTLETKNTNFNVDVETLINEIPETVDGIDDITKVVVANDKYKGLLGYQSIVPAVAKTKLEASIDKVASYMDSVIVALDDDLSSYYNDVNAAYQLYIALPVEMQNKVTKLVELSNAIKSIQ